MRLLLVVGLISSGASLFGDDEKEAVIRSSRKTIGSLLEVMKCGNEKWLYQEKKELVIGLSFGCNREELSLELIDALVGAGLGAVGNAEFTSKRLHGASETNVFDFGVFDDVDAIVNGLARAHWQELMATYPRAKLIVLLGDTSVEVPSYRDSRVRLRACHAIPDYDYVSAAEAISVWGSGCPSLIQKAKVEHQIVSEIIENAPRNRSLIFDTRLFNENSIASRSSRIARFATTTQGVYGNNMIMKWWSKNTIGPHAMIPLLGTDWSPNLGFALRGNAKINTKRIPLLLVSLSAESRRALASVLQVIGYNTSEVRAAHLASYDDQFNWRRSALSSAPLPTSSTSTTTAAVFCLPGLWREFYEAFGPETKVIVTMSSHSLYEDHSSRIDLRQFGISQHDWDNARATRENVKNNYRASSSSFSSSSQAHSSTFTKVLQHNMSCNLLADCQMKCQRMLKHARAKGEFYTALTRLSAAGDQHCNLNALTLKRKRIPNNLGFDFINHLIRMPSRDLISKPHAPDQPSYQQDDNMLLSRIPLHHSLCPSALTLRKSLNNFYRHIIRVVPNNKLLVIDLANTESLDSLCPFLFGLSSLHECFSLLRRRRSLSSNDEQGTLLHNLDPSGTLTSLVAAAASSPIALGGDAHDHSSASDSDDVGSALPSCLCDL